MPNYVYVDKAGHTMAVTHGYEDNPVIICTTCSLAMWRKPQAVLVNWNGMPPSKGFVSPAIKEQLAKSREWNETHPPEDPQS